jgi:uncharacterized LabA/DUF88 family protein
MFKAKTPQIGILAQKFPERIRYLERLLTDQTVVYIDFGNVRGWTKRLGWQIDLKKLKELFDSFGVAETRFYFGTFPGDVGSQKFMTFVHRIGYTVRTKTVKIMQLSIDVSSISPRSPDILNNFIKDTLLRQLRIEVIEHLNEELGLLNKAGMLHIEQPKCNFDVEIASDMRVAHLMKKASSFCLWSGDSDFADTVKELINDKKTVSVFGTARVIASELNELKSRGLEIFDIKKLREFIEKLPVQSKRDSLRSLSA